MEGLENLDVETVRAFERRWEDLFDRGEHATMAAFYAEDAQLVAAGLDTIVGRPAIERFWETACRGARAAGVHRTVRVAAIDRGDRFGALRGTVELRRPEGDATVRYVTLWRREPSGAWRIAVDISSPAPAPAR